MEDVLDLYHAPYDPQFPLVCMDESNKQLVGEVHASLAPPRTRQINDHEYVRQRSGGKSFWKLNRGRTPSCRHHRTAHLQGLGRLHQSMLDERYPQHQSSLVMDNLKHPQRRLPLRSLRTGGSSPGGFAGWKSTTLPNTGSWLNVARSN